MTNFKVGDKVRAIDNRYGCTTLEYEWEGVITRVHNNGEFDAKTTKSLVEHDANGAVVYEDLEAQHFELISEKVSDKPTKKQRIKTLESQVAELQAEVAALKKAQATPKFEAVTTDNIAVGDKIRMVNADGIIGGYDSTNGKIYEVAIVVESGRFYYRDDEGDLLVVNTAEFSAVEKVVSE